MDKLSHLLDAVEPLLPPTPEKIDWSTTMAVSWVSGPQRGSLRAVELDTQIALEDVLGVDTQKNKVVQNTRQFIKGLPANNVLLTGSRGTGKSSLIKALLNAFSDQGLRVIQVDKHDLQNMPQILEVISDQAYRYILFCDDLSFNEDDTNYKVLKSILDGAMYALPENVAIYATSNRRHLMPEYQRDNEASALANKEIHHGEVVEEKISLSDRFGLWVSFYPMNQALYLAVAEHWVNRLGVTMEPKAKMLVKWSKAAQAESLRWALVRGNRSGRSAYQFARHWVGQVILEKSGL
ncbi:MAG: ATP-binding protein [Pseudomonadales bacterium]|nr:ATP-binding protein [Pseudomonadales bacterium]